MNDKKAMQFRDNYNKLMKQGRAFVAPVSIIETEIIKAPAKILFFNITSLSFKYGYCFASDKTLAERMGTGVSTVKEYVKELEEKKFIIRDTRKKLGKSERKIYINFDTLWKLEAKRKRNEKVDNSKAVKTDKEDGSGPTMRTVKESLEKKQKDAQANKKYRDTRPY